MEFLKQLFKKYTICARNDHHKMQPLLFHINLICYHIVISFEKNGVVYKCLQLFTCGRSCYTSDCDRFLC